jgi:anaerobic selenocysteine-containing dehydrogenase
MSSDQVINTVCAHNCGGRARLACTVRAGKLVRVAAADMPDPSYTGACVRCLTLPQWVYSKERIAQPMRRTGARGSGQFEPVSWDTALGEIAARFTALIGEHGTQSIAFTRSSGTSTLGRYTRLAALLGGGGSMDFYGGVDLAVHMGLNSTFGDKGMYGQHANEWTDRVRSKFILVWGHNPAETALTSMKFLLNARDAGSELVVIDPRYSATAMHATWWLAPRVGSDLALALGLLRILITENLIDASFAVAHSSAPLLVRLDNGRLLRVGDAPGDVGTRAQRAGEAAAPSPHAGTEAERRVGPTGSGAGKDAAAFRVWDGERGRACAPHEAAAATLDWRGEVDGIPAATVFNLLAANVAAYTPEKVAQHTGLKASDILDLGHAYARSKPAVIGFGYGVDRYRHGELLVRAAAAMAILTGNVGQPGGGVGVQSHGSGFRLPRMARDKPLPPWARTTPVPMIEVTQRELPVRALFCQGDWLNQRMGDMNKTAEYLKKLEFVVTVDHFWQTTTQWSDIVLPASTFLEATAPVRDAVVTGNSVLLRQKVIDPVGDSRPDADIERDLAQRLGLGEWFAETADEIVRGQIDGARDPAFAGITYERLIAAGGGLRLDVPPTPNVQYADLCFTTPTGRAELYLEELADMGEALPVYVEDHEAHRSHPLAAEFPLVLVQAHVRQRAHSTFFNTGWTLEVWPEPTLEMNPDDAAARGLASGDLGEAHNHRGHVVARVVCNPDLPPGMCNLGEGWKQQQYISGNVQMLTNDLINDAHTRVWGHSNIPFYDTRIEVRRANTRNRANAAAAS